MQSAYKACFQSLDGSFRWIRFCGVTWLIIPQRQWSVGSSHKTVIGRSSNRSACTLIYVPRMKRMTSDSLVESGILSPRVSWMASQTFFSRSFRSAASTCTSRLAPGNGSSTLSLAILPWDKQPPGFCACVHDKPYDRSPLHTLVFCLRSVLASATYYALVSSSCDGNLMT